MQLTMTRPDGLHILAGATLDELAADEMFATFADGVLLQAFARLTAAERAQSLAAALTGAGPAFNGLLAALLALDAHLAAVVDDTSRVIPLPGFISYRARLAARQVTPNTLRLPPLNPDGHYFLVHNSSEEWLALRLDLNPELQVMGHVRLAVAGPDVPPQRLLPVEHRLDRQELTEALIDAVLPPEALPLSSQTHHTLRQLLRGLLA